MPVSMPPSTSAPRCGACQLQLCKSRQEPPHARLRQIEGREAGRDEREPRSFYTCETCGTTLIRSDDPAVAGWAAPRRAIVLARTTAESANDAAPPRPPR